jgi:hypothetical protein
MSINFTISTQVDTEVSKAALGQIVQPLFTSGAFCSVARSATERSWNKHLVFQFKNRFTGSIFKYADWQTVMAQISAILLSSILN